MNTRKRKTRSDKFPLTLHKTGQYCKKIKGKTYYFGKDKKLALERYQEHASMLYSSRNTVTHKSFDMTLKTLSELYLQHQLSKVQSSELTALHYTDQSKCLGQFINSLGQYLKIKDISTLDLQKYKRQIKKRYSSQRLNLNISVMKAMFHWAKKNDILTAIPNIDAVSRCKIDHQQRMIFTSEQIQALFEKADAQMKAMIWLGLNCGFGCKDCAQLEWNNLDLEKKRVYLPRGKTGVMRDLVLWPETVDALRKVSHRGNLVFYTKHGKPMVSVRCTGTGNTIKYTLTNMVTTQFARLIKKAGLQVPKGTGFYGLRRTAATLAARSGDPFAVQRLLGHADLKMATRYVQDVSKQTDDVIEKSRKYMIL
jgi:integrase